MLNYKITFVDCNGMILSEVVSAPQLNISGGFYNSLALATSGSVIKLEMITV